MVWEIGNMVIGEFNTFNWIRKNIILDFYIWCHEAVIHKYVLRYVSNVSRINLQSWTTYWDLWSKWYILHLIQVLHTINRWQLIFDTWKTATYDTTTVYYSMTYDGQLQIHIYIDT